MRSRFHASVHVYEVEEYRDMRLFAVDDGSAGFALKGDDVVSVFCYQDSRHRGSTLYLLATAVAEGGRRLDCYDTVLPELYAEAGFVPVARMKWDDQWAPDDWDHATYSRYNNGRPDVVFMAYNPAAIDSDYDPSAGEYVAEYDDGPHLVDGYLNR